MDARTEIEDLLERSPSLRQEVGREIVRQTKRAHELAIRDLGRRGEIDAAAIAALRAASYTEEQVLGDWFPEEPPAEREVTMTRSGATFRGRLPILE